MALNLIPQASAYGINGGRGSKGGRNFLAPIPVAINRAPTSSDGARIGQLLINGNVPYIAVGNGNTWIPLSGGSGTFTDLNVSNDITAGGFIDAGTTIDALGNITTSLGNLRALAGDLVLASAGSGITIGVGANASIGTSAPMVAGTVTVNTTAVSASSLIFLSVNTPGGTQGILSAPSASIVAGTSFVINSSSATDTSTVNYWIIN